MQYLSIKNTWVPSSYLQEEKIFLSLFFFIFIFLVELFSRSLLAANEGLLGYKQYMWMGCTWFCLCPILWGKDCSYLVSSTANLWVCVCVFATVAAGSPQSCHLMLSESQLNLKKAGYIRNAWMWKRHNHCVAHLVWYRDTRFDLSCVQSSPLLVCFSRT